MSDEVHTSPVAKTGPTPATFSEKPRISGKYSSECGDELPILLWISREHATRGGRKNIASFPPAGIRALAIHF
jgi:hypothetical protein